MPEYIAYYPGSDAALILTAQPSKFPRRTDRYQAAKDARDYWHTQGEHLIVWRINEDGTVTPCESKVRRAVEVTA